MKQRTLIFGLIVAILMVVFALQNALTVQVKLWFWQFESSLALVLLIALAVGALLGILFSLPSKRARKEKPQEKAKTPEKETKPSEEL